MKCVCVVVYISNHGVHDEREAENCMYLSVVYTYRTLFIVLVKVGPVHLISLDCRVATISNHGMYAEKERCMYVYHVHKCANV